VAGILAQRNHEPGRDGDDGADAPPARRFWIIQTGLLAGLQFTEQKVEVVAYLQTNATDTQVKTLQTQLEGMPEVASVTYVSRDEALDQFRQSMQAQGRQDLTRYLDAKPAVRQPRGQAHRPIAVRVVSDALRGDPSIRNVINIEDLVNRVLTVTGSSGPRERSCWSSSA
jgi:cell division protein FtsX